MIELVLALRAIQSSFMVYKWTMEPGPASTVEERPLRKFSSEGTAVRSPPRVFLFRRELIREN